MGLFGSSGGGSYLRFSPAANMWALGKEEIQLQTLGFDMGSIRTGWGLLAEGQSPQWVWDNEMGRPGVKPEGDFKRGASVRVWLGPDRGWAEWSTTGVGPVQGMEAACEDAFKAGAKVGELAVFSYEGSTAIKVGKGTTRVPKFKYAQAMPMPQGEGAETKASNPSNTAPPATGSKVAAPPTSNGGGLGFG